jgi:predicted metallo-beta-lactamase superfamily hydrolase
MKFTPEFAEIIKPLQKMIHKDVKFKWDDERKYAFNNIKVAISRALVLRSPDFNRDFFLYTFSSDKSLAVVLTQKDDGNKKAPVSFMSTNLQGAELNYPAVDKQAYAVYKAVKNFRSYILKNHTKVIVPHPVVRSLFTQKEMGERRGN